MLNNTDNFSNIEDVKSSMNNTINKNSSIMYNQFLSRPESRADGRVESRIQSANIAKSNTNNLNNLSNINTGSKI